MPENFFLHLHDHEQDRRRHEENSARTATQYVTFETTGAGDLIPTEPVRFDNPFFAEPAVVWGMFLARQPNRNFYYLPQVTGMVYRWLRDRRGWYAGAYLSFRVSADYRPDVDPLEAPRLRPVIYHHFAFTGPSFKQMTRDVRAPLAADEHVRPLRPPM